MEILFWLYKSRSNRKGLIPVMMWVTLNESRINFPTRIEIEESVWDKDRQQIKGSNELATAYNRQLLTLKAKAWDYYSECIKKEIIPSLNYKECLPH